MGSGQSRLGIKGLYATGAAPWALRERRAAGAAWGGGVAPGEAARVGAGCLGRRRRQVGSSEERAMLEERLLNEQVAGENAVDASNPIVLKITCKVRPEKVEEFKTVSQKVDHVTSGMEPAT